MLPCLAILNTVFMTTNDHMVKKEIFYRCFSAAVIFVSIMAISASIYLTHNQWIKNSGFATEHQRATKILPSALPQVWHLSSQAPINEKADLSISEPSDTLVGVVLHGIIFSSDSRASRAILLEGDEQHSYALAEPLRSLPETHIIAIYKDQVTLSSNGKVNHLNFLPDTPLPAREDNVDENERHYESGPQFHAVKEN